MNTINIRHLPMMLLVPFLLFSMGCSDDGPTGPDKIPSIQGVVADEDGHTYPSVAVILRNASSGVTLESGKTDAEGSFEFQTVAPGSYELAIDPPRASEVVGTSPTSVTVIEGATATGDVIVRPLPIEGIVVGAEDYAESDGGTHDIRNASGEMPGSPGEPIYHSRDLEALDPITAPDGHHVSFAEWLSARGTARVTCDGSKGTQYTLALDSLIPNGVYSVGAVLVNFTPMPTRVGTGALGRSDGSDNWFRASATGEGQLEVRLRPGPMSLNGNAPACVLTQVSSVTLWLFYHVDGQREAGSEESWVEHLRVSI